MGAILLGNLEIFLPQKQLERVLSLILDDVDRDYIIKVVEVRPFGPHILVEFYAVREDDHQVFMNATQAYFRLTDKGQDYYYPNSGFHFVRIDMKGMYAVAHTHTPSHIMLHSIVCRLPCSGHGTCDRKTHKCSCMRYWMENPIKANFGNRETNCGQYNDNQ